MARAKARYRPWPRLKAVHPPQIDKERIRFDYLSGKYASFIEWARDQGYNVDAASSRENIPYKVWQTEYVQQQMSAMEEESLDKALSLKKFIIEERFQNPRDWVHRLKAMKGVLDSQLQIQYLRAAKDQQNKEAIIAGSAQPTVDIPAMKNLALIAQNLQHMEERALLLPGLNLQKEIIPIERTRQEDQLDRAEFHRLQDVKFALMDGTALDHAEMNRLRNEWSDQIKNEATAIEVEPIQNPEDKPLDEIE